MHFYYEAYQVQGFVQRKIISNVSSWTNSYKTNIKLCKIDMYCIKKNKEDIRLDENASKNE